MPAELTVDRLGATIAAEQVGDGPPVVMVHCSSASRREWRFAAQALGSSHRCYLPDLLGYGRTSGQFDDNGRLVECRDTDVVAAMVDQAGEPVDIVAHSYGAAASLEFAKARPHAVKSMFLIEPVSFQLLRNPGFEAEWRTVSELADNIIRAEAAGNGKRAASHYMVFWLGRLRWMLAPRKFRSSVISSIGKVAFEFSQIYELPPALEPLAGLGMPVTMVAGGRTRQPARAVAGIVSSTIPRCTQVTIEGAGHMSPFTHSGEVLRLVRSHLSHST